MARRIVVLSDGTGNSAASTTPTNVWRLYEALDLTTPGQIASFDDGVGTSGIKPLQVLGLALGIGVKRNVLDLYKFLCRHWTEGDEIFAFGFSRGAFTIRVLCGLIAEEGLLRAGSDEELDREAVAAYRRYRRKCYAKPTLSSALRRVRDAVLALRDKALGRSVPPVVAPGAAPQGLVAVKPVPIRFIGVWDTVEAYGLPIEELTNAVNRWVWPMTFGNQALRPNVQTARHALSLDDPRRTFFPLPWDDPVPGTPYGQSVEGRRILQVWFAGAHANVGGGYPDDRLAHIPLCWMIDEAARCGLTFKPSAVARYRDIASHNGRIYDPRTGLGMFYRYQPRSLANLVASKLPPGTRPLVHESVILRMAEGTDRYSPIAIDTDVDILAADNTPVKFAPPASMPAPPLQSAMHRLIDGSIRAERQQCTDRALDLVWWRRLLYFVMVGLATALALYPWWTIRIPALDTPNALAADLLYPVLVPMEAFVPAGGWWVPAVRSQPLPALALAGLFAMVLSFSGLLKVRIGDWGAAGWSTALRERAFRIDAARKQAQLRAWPWAGGLTTAAGLATLAAGSLVSSLSPGWSSGLVALGAAITALGLAALGALLAIHRHAPPGPDTAPQTWLLLLLARRLRTAPGPVMAYRCLKTYVVPAALLLLVAFLGPYTLLARGWFDLRAGLGGVCHARAAQVQVGTVPESLGTFPIDDPCWASGAVLEDGARYRITLESPQDEGWFDLTGYADMGGVARQTLLQTSVSLAKRWWGQPYLKPIARIGTHGRTEFALDPVEPLGPAPMLRPHQQADYDSLMEQCGWCCGRITPQLARSATAVVEEAGTRRTWLVAEFTATKSGQLFLYVNDAVPLWPGGFYGNNHGTATVTIQRLQ
jgi:uncharacterized protein (DUF2235 family)